MKTRPHKVLPCYTVECPLCGACVGEPCRYPSDQVADNPHRDRVLLSMVPKGGAAVGVISKILADTKKRDT